MTPSSFYRNVGTVFGWQDDYPTDGQHGYHHGVDFPWGRGVDIPSWTAGVVVRNQFNNALGNYLVIDRGPDVPTIQRYAGFCHMDGHSPLPVGSPVWIGSVIGQVGDTGEANGPHLHATLSSSVYPGDGPWTDPLPLIRASTITTSPAGSNTEPLPADPEPIIITLEGSDMTTPLYAKGDKTPAGVGVYACYLDASVLHDTPTRIGGNVQFARRAVGKGELGIITANKIPIAVIPQADFDAIPKVQGSL